MSDVMILSERNPNAKSIWITVRNTHGENRLQVVLEIDGKEEILEDSWIPGLDSSEGVHLYSHQLTNLFKGRDQEIQTLKAMILEARKVLNYSAGDSNVQFALEQQWLTKTENIRVEE